MRGFYSDNKEIFMLVEKREGLWGRLQEFEVIEANVACVDALQLVTAVVPPWVN